MVYYIIQSPRVWRTIQNINTPLGDGEKLYKSPWPERNLGENVKRLTTHFAGSLARAGVSCSSQKRQWQQYAGMRPAALWQVSYERQERELANLFVLLILTLSLAIVKEERIPTNKTDT